MAGKALAEVLIELLGSLSDEQKRAIQQALQQGAVLIQTVIAAECARQPARLPSQTPRPPADIPDMRGRWP